MRRRSSVQTSSHSHSKWNYSYPFVKVSYKRPLQSLQSIVNAAHKSQQFHMYFSCINAMSTCTPREVTKGDPVLKVFRNSISLWTFLRIQILRCFVSATTPCSVLQVTNSFNLTRNAFCSFEFTTFGKVCIWVIAWRQKCSVCAQKLQFGRLNGRNPTKSTRETVSLSTAPRIWMRSTKSKKTCPHPFKFARFQIAPFPGCLLETDLQRKNFQKKHRRLFVSHCCRLYPGLHAHAWQ